MSVHSLRVFGKARGGSGRGGESGFPLKSPRKVPRHTHPEADLWALIAGCQARERRS